MLKLNLSYHWLVCGYNSNLELVYTLKFSALSCCSSSHATEFWELYKVLESSEQLLAWIQQARGKTKHGSIKYVPSQLLKMSTNLEKEILVAN